MQFPVVTEDCAHAYATYYSGALDICMSPVSVWDATYSSSDA